MAVIPTHEGFSCDIIPILVGCTEKQLIFGALFLHLLITHVHVIIIKYISISAFLKYDECMFVPLELRNPSCAPDVIN